jgi:uncharacterized protein CbrC (UPF0167 family)
MRQELTMSGETLPQFKYHPDPVATGSVEKSDATCVCCGRARGYVYTGPVYAIAEYDRNICPWCIADGTAHEKLKASFQDEAGIGGYGDWDPVPLEVMEEVAYRTPGFSGWQQEQWWTHCGDAGMFVGRAGREEVEEAGEDAIAAVRASAGIEDDDEWEEFFDSLDKDASPTAYLFKCPKCGKYGGYQDGD